MCSSHLGLVERLEAKDIAWSKPSCQTSTSNPDRLQLSWRGKGITGECGKTIINFKHFAKIVSFR